MLKAVFFDLDDTLEDRDEARKAVKGKLSSRVEKEFGINGKEFFKIFKKAEYEFVGVSSNPKDYNRKVWLRETLKRMGVRASESKIKELERLYWKTVFAKIKTFPDTKDVLRKLEAYKRIMVTDSDGCLNNYIKNNKIRILGLRKYFDLIVTSNDTGKNKPDKSLWRKGLKKFNLKPSECIMIGDKPEMDLKPTKEMGMKTVWMKKGRWASTRKGKKFNYVDYEVTNLSKLLGILKNEQK